MGASTSLNYPSAFLEIPTSMMSGLILDEDALLHASLSRFDNFGSKAFADGGEYRLDLLYAGDSDFIRSVVANSIRDNPTLRVGTYGFPFAVFETTEVLAAGSAIPVSSRSVRDLGGPAFEISFANRLVGQVRVFPAILNAMLALLVFFTLELGVKKW
jgi:hypothetical protein